MPKVTAVLSTSFYVHKTSNLETAQYRTLFTLSLHFPVFFSVFIRHSLDPICQVSGGIPSHGNQAGIHRCLGPCPSWCLVIRVLSWDHDSDDTVMTLFHSFVKLPDDT